MLHKFAGQPDGAVPVSSLTIFPSGICLAPLRKVVRIIWALCLDYSHPRMPAIHGESGSLQLWQYGH